MSELKRLNGFGNFDKFGGYYDAEAVDSAIAEKDAEIAELKQAIKIKDDLLIENGKEIGSLKAENESLKYSVATLETDLAMLKRWRKVSEELPEDDTYVLATDGDRIWLCRKDTMPDGSPWFQPDGLPHIDDVTHWMPLPELPAETNK